MSASERYERAMHAVQAGVSWQMENQPEKAGITPKSLRTGVNSALVDSHGLALLLMKKGIFTSEEYMEAMAEAAETEQARYQAIVNEHYGHDKIVLGGLSINEQKDFYR